MTTKREQLENAATKAVQQGGLNNLSFRTLADEVGVKSSSVHYYFPEKADLTRVLIEKYTHAFLEVLQEISATETQPKKQLKRFVEVFEDVLNDERICLCGMLAAEVATLNDDNRKLLKQFFTQAEDWLYALFKKHKDHLLLPTPPKQLAKIVLSGLEGSMLIDHAEGTKTRIKMQYQFIDQLVQL